MSQMREILRQLMERTNESPYDLYVNSGVRASTTYRFLNSTHGEPIPSTVRKWAAHYGVTEAQLRGFEPIAGVVPPKPSAPLKPPPTANLSAAEQAHLENLRTLTREERTYVYRLAALFAEFTYKDAFGGRRKEKRPDNPQQRRGETHYAPVVRGQYAPMSQDSEPESPDQLTHNISPGNL